MAPQAGGGEGLVVSLGFEAFASLVVGEASSLGQAINTFVNFKVHPPVADEEGELVCVDKLLGDISQLDSHIFGAIKRSSKVKVADVEAREFCSTA